MRRPAPLLLVSLAVALAACGGGDAATTTSAPATTTTSLPDLVTYRSETLDFRIDHPVGWVVSEEPEAGLVVFTEPTGEGGYADNFNVNVGSVPEDLPARAYYDGEVTRLEDALGEVEVIEIADLTVIGLPARGITLVTDQGGFEVGISRIVLKRGDTAYEVTYFTAGSRFEERSPLIQRILASFRPVA